MAYLFIPDVISTLQPPDNGILSRTVFQDDSLKIVGFAFSAGQELSEHTASKPAILQFLQGQASLTLDEDRHETGPGAWVHMPAHLKHSIRAITPLVLILTIIKNTG